MIAVCVAAAVCGGWGSVDGAIPGQAAGGALAGDRPRVIVSTDIGGSDPDDCQSLIHLLLYADVLDLEGIVASPPGKGRLRDILEVLDTWEADYGNLVRHAPSYPPADALRQIAFQGAVNAAPPAGWSRATDGSRHILRCARRPASRPLWILVWGSLTDVAQAVHDDPSIVAQIRLISIGSWNTHMDPAARNYLYRDHPNLWWIESNSTFRGMYVGGRQDGSWGNLTFVQQHVRGHGALGRLFFEKKADIKMGDTPSLLYLLRGDPDLPESPHWGGRYAKTDHSDCFWTDHPEERLKEQAFAGARTVSRWRPDILSDWMRRMDRTLPKQSAQPAQ